MAIVDLHLHSNFSDGSDDIESLALNIQKAGIKTFALTDHDTIEGCAEIIKHLPKEIKFIPSIELTCKVGSIKCHILGYNCDYKNSVLTKLINKGKDLRRKKLETRINYLREAHGIILTTEELDWLYSRKSVVKTHIANVLVKRGFAKDNLSAMHKYLDACKSGDTRFTGEEAINAIVAAGGIPVWAHPLGGEGETHLKENEFIPKLKEMMSFNIKGLECYYSRYSLEESEFLARCAKENNLLISGGSDYHGNNKNNIKIGTLNNKNYQIPSENLTILSLL